MLELDSQAHFERVCTVYTVNKANCSSTIKLLRIKYFAEKRILLQTHSHAGKIFTAIERIMKLRSKIGN